MDALVDKILKARDIQKQGIEQNNIETEKFKANVQQTAKPIVDALSEGTLSMTQNISAMKDLAIQGQPQHALTMNDTTGLPDISLAEYTGESKWVQYMYQKYRDQGSSKTTSFEADMDGTIGLRGKIDMPLLFNTNKLAITIDKEDEPPEQFGFPDSGVTEGLVGLILLTYTDMKTHKIAVLPQDHENYLMIMNAVGFRPSSSKKYKQLKDTQERIKKLELKAKETEGKGIWKTCSSNKELEARLLLLLGSMKSGNTSKAMKREAGDILDKLLEVNYITSNMHSKFYLKFNLF